MQPGSAKSVLASNTPQLGGASASTSHEDISSVSTNVTTRSSLIPVLNTRRQSRLNYSETRLSTEKIINAVKRGTKQKHSNTDIQATTSQESVAGSSSSSNSVTTENYRHKLRNSTTKREVEASRSRSRSESSSHNKKRQDNSKRNKSNDRHWKKRNNRSLNTTTTATKTSVGAVQQQVTHNYSLRNRLSSNSTIASNNRVSTQEQNKKESVALGASTSHQATREEQEPSRLTRSGAVLRRSTRNSKGEYKCLQSFLNSENEVTTLNYCIIT